MKKSGTVLRDALAALSLANFCFIRVWAGLLSYTKEQTFFFEQLPGPAQYTATAIDVLLLTAIFFAMLITFAIIRVYDSAFA